MDERWKEDNTGQDRDWDMEEEEDVGKMEVERGQVKIGQVLTSTRNL